MKPKRSLGAYRFRFTLIACLLCLIALEVTSHSFTKYNIPFVGWILAVGEYRHAHAAYWQAVEKGVPPWLEYSVTQTAYDRTQRY